jgi:rubrerythrin
LRAHDDDPRVTGPHEPGPESEERDLFWRCENCGHTSTDPELRKGCPVCHRGVGWLP